MLKRRGCSFVAAILCVTIVAGCGPERDAGSDTGITGQPALAVPTQTALASPTATADPVATVRGSVTFALATKDGYKGTVTLTAYEPTAFNAYPGSAALTECTPYANPTSTALVRVDFAFRDQSPPAFPWKLSWGAAAFGSGRAFATRSGPSEQFACLHAEAWSGAGTMSVLMAMDDYFSPKTPKGSPERLKDTGAEFPLVEGVSSGDITVASSTGNVRGGVSNNFGPWLQIAFGATA